MTPEPQVDIRPHGPAWTWSIALSGGATLSGPAPSPESAQRSADFVRANLAALARIGSRRKF